MMSTTSEGKKALKSGANSVEVLKSSRWSPGVAGSAGKGRRGNKGIKKGRFACHHTMKFRRGDSPRRRL